MTMQPWMPSGAFGSTTQGPAPTPTGSYQFPAPSPTTPPTSPATTTGGDIPWWERALKGWSISPETRPKQPAELTPGAISFETILTSGVTTLENKLRLIEAYYPDRMAEAIDILASPEYDLPYTPSDTEGALETYKVTEGEDAEDPFAAPPFPTEPPPEGYVWKLNDLNQWIPQYVGKDAVADFGEEPEGRFYYDDAGNLHQVSFALTSGGWDQQDTIVQFAQREPLSTQPTTYEPFGTDPYGGQGQWNPYSGSWEAPPGYIDPYQRKLLDLQGQELAQQGQWQEWQQAEAQRQYGAQLRAQGPGSWLEYAAYTGQQPAIQPWMLPLMPQQYSQLGAGQAIPGWEAPPEGQMGASAPGGLPELTRPSRQYQARIGPTALQQYYGYQQAQTGATPQETDWRLYSMAPPGGRNQGLSYTR